MHQFNNKLMAVAVGPLHILCSQLSHEMMYWFEFDIFLNSKVVWYEINLRLQYELSDYVKFIKKISTSL